MLKSGIAASLVVVLGAVGWTLLGDDEEPTLSLAGTENEGGGAALVVEERGADLSSVVPTEIAEEASRAPVPEAAANAEGLRLPRPGHGPDSVINRGSTERRKTQVLLVFGVKVRKKI